VTPFQIGATLLAFGIYSMGCAAVGWLARGAQNWQREMRESPFVMPPVKPIMDIQVPDPRKPDLEDREREVPLTEG
jgi:hypothetical protein